MSDAAPIISIDLGKKCSRCGREGTAENGLCLTCITANLTASIKREARGGTCCPVCDGRRQVDVPLAAPGSALRTNQRRQCWFCKGAGEVSPEKARLLARGRSKMRERMEAGRSLEEEAARLGISPRTLEQLEKGMLNPKAVPDVAAAWEA